MEQEKRAKTIQKIIAKAWMDEGFEQRLLSHPAAVLKEEGVEVSPDVELRVLESTAKVRYFVLPAKPSESSIEESESKLAAVLF